MGGPVEYGIGVGGGWVPRTDGSLKVTPPEDTQEVAEKLARFVADNGPEVEAIAAQHNRDNPSFGSVGAVATAIRFFLFFLSRPTVYPFVYFRCDLN